MELGSYGPFGDPRAHELPWLYRSVMPDPGQPALVESYYSQPTYQFGEWCFEQTCLDFCPDIVADVRDWWMCEYQARSPFRDKFFHVLMPTVDALPQDEQWMATYLSTDALLTYSDWGAEVLLSQSNGLAPIRGSAPPAADMEVFSPVPDKRQHRTQLGIDPDCFIIGTVMRNQKRKLYPDLIDAYVRFLKNAPESIARKTFLYLHTSFPDVGWDIPRLIQENGVASRCVFTYHCRSCRATFPSFYQDARTYCRRCGRQTATLPNSHEGVSRETLAKILNLFDCYVQYANSEGFGMPQVEAAACGVPVFATDYSAMSDVVRKLEGYPVRLLHLLRESETHCLRAIPDNAHLAEQLIAFFSLPLPVRSAKRYATRRAAARHFSYDRSAQVWMEVFDGVQPTRMWQEPIMLSQAEPFAPQADNASFVRWALTHVARRPDLVSSFLAMRMVRDLNWGSTMPGMGGLYFNESSTLGTQQRFQTFTQEDCYNECLNMLTLKNHWEAKRMEAKN
jgi:glycosyltransferase involved in cell wall biosynthesis